MPGISSQDLLDENPPFGQPPLAEIKIRQAGLERRVVRIVLQRLPDLFLRLPVFSAFFKGPDVIDLLSERLVPIRFKSLLERLNEEILMKLPRLCKRCRVFKSDLFRGGGKDITASAPGRECGRAILKECPGRLRREERSSF